MANRIVGYELSDGIGLCRIDDGKANVISFDFIAELHEALDRAEKEAGAVLLVGRPGRFSAGFDMNVMGGGPEQMSRLVAEGCKLFARFLTYPRPIVAACTGHALAAGAMLLLSSDFRIGASGAFKIGLNEVAIGLTPPFFLVALAQGRVAPPHLQRALVQAEIHTPDLAVSAGFLDSVVEPEALLDAARAHAARLAPLPSPVFGVAKQRMNEALARRVIQGLERDLAAFAEERDASRR